MTDAVLKQIGRSKLQNILKTTPQQELSSQLIQCVRQAGFSIDQHRRKDHTPIPLKKPRAEQMKQELENMDMDNLQLEPGFFIDGDGQPIVQTDKSCTLKQRD